MKLLDREKRYIEYLMKNEFNYNFIHRSQHVDHIGNNITVGYENERRVKPESIVSTGKNSFIVGECVQNYELLNPSINTGDCSFVYFHTSTTTRLPCISLGSHSIILFTDYSTYENKEHLDNICPLVVQGNDGCFIDLSFNSIYMTNVPHIYKVIGDRFILKSNASSYGPLDSLTVKSITGDIEIYEDDTLIFSIPDKRSVILSLNPNRRKAELRSFDRQMRQQQDFIDKVKYAY